jgi:hypothetical protein
MSTLNTLPNLTPLGGGQAASSSPASGASSTPAAAPASCGLTDVSCWTAQIENWITANEFNWVAILLGLILIVAGLFSFRTVRTVTARGAELAAAA